MFHIWTAITYGTGGVSLPDEYANTLSQAKKIAKAQAKQAESRKDGWYNFATVVDKTANGWTWNVYVIEIRQV